VVIDTARRLLIIEDNRDLAGVLAALLQRAGHEVQVAHDGAAGLAIAERMRPEIVVLDLGLPVLDGFEVARRLRQIPDLAPLVIIAMSGYGSENDREKSKQARIDHHLVKPKDVEKIETLIASLGARQRPHP
jgi:two-component system CheB/CheR fusion protein